MDELQRLIAEARAFAEASERFAGRIDAEIARVWRDWARALEQLLHEQALLGRSTSLELRIGQIAGLKDSIRRALAEAGYDAAAVAAVQSATRLWVNTLPRTSIATQIDALQRLHAFDLLVEGDQYATTLWRSMTQAVLTPRPVRDIIADLSKSLDISQGRAGTLFDTQMTIFGRQIEAAKAEELGRSQPFMYVGPVDAKTRDWCLGHVGKVYTRDEIDGLDNGQIPNVMLTAGGFNCRHVWMAVESQALRGLAGTGERADGFAEDVKRVREARKKKAA